MRPTDVSLFAGVGGIDLALERAGFEVVAAVEKDKAAQGVLRDRFPHLTLFDDVTEVSADELRAAGFVPERGLLAAGWPCQGNSVAGRRGGLADPRSGLWRHVVRLLAELNPRWFLGENVPGLLSVTEGEDFGLVLSGLADLGYGFAYRVLDAQHFGVPQRRRRVFIVGRLGDTGAAPAQVLLEPEGSDRDPAAGQQEGQRVAATLTSGTHGAGVSAPGRRQEDDVNLVVSTLQRGAGGDTASTPKQQRAGTSSSRREVVAALTADGVGTCGPDDNQAQAGHLVTHTHTFQKVVRSGERDVNGNLPPEVWAQRDVAPTLNCRDNASDSQATELIVAPALTTRCGNTQDDQQTGQLVVTATGDKAHALTSEGADASEDGTGRGTPIIGFAWQAGGNNDASGAFEEDMVPTLPRSQTLAIAETVRTHPRPGSNSSGQITADDTTVRRLTPLECERLQGFPDGWTATSNGKPQADSARYRQMGNAVAVPCVEWIARRIAAVDEGAAS